jgi:transcriptional regulator with XRE-family HTH domain
VRRPRLLLGLTQSEFAEHFDVETSTVSRWERGLVMPMPKARAEITKIATRTDTFQSKVIIQVSPVFKYLSTRDNLHTPVVISKGVTAYLDQVGYTFHDFMQGRVPWTQPDDPGYEVSASHCLREIEKDPR